MFNKKLKGIALIFLLNPFSAFAETKIETKQSLDSKSAIDDSTATAKAKDNQNHEIEKASKDLFGIDPKNKFSIYQPTYFVFGIDDLKLQFSGKYRVTRSLNLYLGYTQTMFWSIYAESQPFDDINYSPEIFYRLIEGHSTMVKSIDFGVNHTSNGEDSVKSRSINRAFLKTNFVSKYQRNSILGEFKLQHIYSKSPSNEDIVDHLGYWDLKLILTHLITHGADRLDLEFKIFSGKSIVNLGKGGREIGLVYHLGSGEFNPAFYLQYYSGYAENLLHYNDKRSKVRAGLLLFF